jgi:2'-5' RNA ligase
MHRDDGDRATLAFMSEHSIRVFLAVAVPDDIRAAINAVVAPLRGQLPRVRWVHSELWHFTLIFLGERPQAEVARVMDMAATECRGASPFSLAVEGTGCFPGAGRPRVLWAGAGSGLDALAGLRTRIHGALRDGGISMPNESFSAHLTVGRVRDDTAPEGRSEIGRLWTATAIPPLTPFDVQEVHLMRSDLGPAGPRYTSLEAFPLSAERAG